MGINRQQHTANAYQEEWLRGSMGADIEIDNDFEQTNNSSGEELDHLPRFTEEWRERKPIQICRCSIELNHPTAELSNVAKKVARNSAKEGYYRVRMEQIDAWRDKWHGCDIEIEGDDEAQQGIRYCIFMLLQTYTGRDNRLNIGPKGFTGEVWRYILGYRGVLPTVLYVYCGE